MGGLLLGLVGWLKLISTRCSAAALQKFKDTKL
jgi:hypothetical protein